MAKNDKHKADDGLPFDLAARIGSRSSDPPSPPPAAPAEALPPRLDGPLPPRREARPAISDEESPKSEAIPSPRTPPGPGEIDLVVTPLPTPDDWHRFELALRRVPGIGHGIGQLKTEYYRQGVLKMRVTYVGEKGLANALRAGVPGYRVRVIGEDRSTVQILVSGNSDERRPG